MTLPSTRPIVLLQMLWELRKITQISSNFEEQKKRAVHISEFEKNFTSPLASLKSNITVLFFCSEKTINFNSTATKKLYSDGNNF